MRYSLSAKKKFQSWCNLSFDERRTILSMKDDFYNNQKSQKMLPLFDIELTNIVPSILYIFIGIASDAKIFFLFKFFDILSLFLFL